MASSPARTKTGDDATSIHVGPWVDKESSGSLRERFLVGGSVASAGSEKFGAAADEAELAPNNCRMKSSGSLRERFAIDGVEPSVGEAQLQTLQDHGSLIPRRLSRTVSGASAATDERVDESDAEGVGECKISPSIF
jgi:hypothetical protein